MPVQINITGADAAESLKELAALAAGFTTATATPASAAEAPKQNRTRSKPAEAPKPEEKPAEAPEEEVETPESDETHSAVTAEEVKTKTREIAKTGKQAQVKALLEKYGNGTVSGLPEDKYIVFLAELEAL